MIFVLLQQSQQQWQSGLDHGMIMTPQHPSIDQIESIPNLPVDQVSSILNGTAMDGFANMGYDAGPSGMSERIANDWTDDYDFPPSVGAPVSQYKCHANKNIEILHNFYAIRSTAARR